jgi:hypothetical protein
VEPFKITCVTCQARLSVRNEGLIGQIVACPKCGSMVQVTAPSRGASAAASAASASGLSSIVVVALQPSASAAAVPPAFDDVGDLGANAPASPPPSIAAPRAAAGASSASPTVAGLSAVKIAAIVVACALAGSALVAGLLSLLGSDDAAPIAASAVAPSSAASPAVSDSSTDAVPVAPEPAKAVEPASPENVAVDNPVATPTAEAPPQSPDGATDNVPPAEPTAAGAQPPASGADAAAVAADATAAPVASPAPRLRIDPLDLDPEGLDIATLLHGPSVDTMAADSAGAPEPAPAPSAAVPADAAGDAPAAGRDAVERSEPANPPAAPKVLLARHIPAVKIEGMPLGRFLDFATTLSAMPVSAAPDELRLAAVSAATGVSVDAKDVTIEELLSKALKPLRLAPTIEGGQIVLRRSVGAQRRELTYPVGDLVASDAQPLADWVQALVEPDSWQVKDGAGSLKVDGTSLRLNQSERVGYATILFLERYRAAVGLAPQSKYPAALLAAWKGVAELDGPLAAPTTFTFSRPTPLGEIFRWWSGELGAAVLVDWPALETQGLRPHTRLLASANQKPWGEAMTAVLKPLGLGWRAVDAHTVEITSLDKMRTEPVVELYRVAAGATTTGAELLEQVRRLGSEAGADAQSATMAVFYDEAHRVLMVRQGAAVQRRVAEWLARAGLLAGERG